MKKTRVKTNWTALIGKIEIKPEEIVIKGEIIQYDATHPGPSITNLKCDQYFDKGSINVDIEFKNIEDIPACEIILNCSNNNKIS